MISNTHSSNKFLMHVVAIAIIAGTSTQAFADNKAAYKNAIAKDAVIDKTLIEEKAPTGTKKMAETKSAEIKSAEPSTSANVDADFKKLDGNNDQKISLKEAVKDKILVTQFDATDMNHDGMLSVDEFAYFKNSAAMKPMDGAVPASN